MADNPGGPHLADAAPHLSDDVRERFSGIAADLSAFFSGGSLGTRLGLRILKADADEVVGTLPVEGNTQPYGLLHGGASAVLAETLGSIGAMIHCGPGRSAVGVDLNVTHHRGATGGTVTGTATPLHRGRTTATYEIVVTDEQERRVCTARLTCLLRDTPARPADQAP